MQIQCPNCHSQRIGTINTAKKAGATIGTAAGVATGLSVASKTARSVMLIATASNPVTALGGLVTSVLLSGMAGSAIGSSVGHVIDENILDNYECLACHHVFSLPQPIDPEVK